MAEPLRFLETTKIALQRSGAKSLKTTIPKRIVEQFHMSIGDDLLWQVLVDPNNLQKCEIKLSHRTAKTDEEFALAVNYDFAKAIIETAKLVPNAKGNKKLERLVNDMEGILKEIDPYKSNKASK